MKQHLYIFSPNFKEIEIFYVYSVANKVMQTKQKTLLVVWTMDDFELTGYPTPEKHCLVNVPSLAQVCVTE